MELPIYDHNTILELSAEPKIAWFFAKMRDGYTQYIGMTPIVWDFHISAEEHAALASEPWPGPSEDTIVVDKEPFKGERHAASETRTSVTPHKVPLNGAEKGGSHEGGGGLRDRMKRHLAEKGGGEKAMDENGAVAKSISPQAEAERP